MLNLVRLFLKLSTFNQRFNLQIIRQLFFENGKANVIGLF